MFCSIDKLLPLGTVDDLMHYWNLIHIYNETLYRPRAIVHQVVNAGVIVLTILQTGMK